MKGVIIVLTLSLILGVVTLATEKPIIESLHIYSDIRLRFSTTLITSRIRNAANESKEITFDMDIPNMAFITALTMNVDGQFYLGEVQDKNIAYYQYEESKNRQESAGHVTVRPKEFNKFKISLVVEKNKTVTFNLTYQELLERKLGVYKHEIYLKPLQPVEDLKVQVRIEEQRPLSHVFVPQMTEELVSVETRSFKLARISRPNAKTALITYQPYLKQQGQKGLDGRFTVEYDVKREGLSGEYYTVDGYFIHFFAPNVTEQFPRQVLFMLDISTSMSDRKLGQVKDAMNSILKQLHDDDTFNIMLFNNEQQLWAPTFQQVTTGTKSKAQKFVENLRSTHYTDINEALLKGLKYFKETSDEGVPMIFFLSDGEPTRGTKSPKQILDNIEKENTNMIPIYSLAFGTGADWNFLQQLSYQSGGIYRRIYEDSSAGLQISQFYTDVSTILLNNIQIRPYYSNGTEAQKRIQEVKPFAERRNYIGGREVLTYGKFETDEKLSLKLLADAPSNQTLTLINSDEIQFVEEKGFDIPGHKIIPSKILARMWAYLSLKKHLQKAAGNNNIHEDLKKELTLLAVTYGFVTPLTSMVVTQKTGDYRTIWEEFDEDYNELHMRTPRPTIKPKPTRRTRYWSGGGGGGGGWGGGGGDPHFMIGLKTLDYPLCFDVTGSKGEIYNLFQDKKLGLYVNVMFDTGVKLTKSGTKRVYIKEVAIVTPHHSFQISHSGIKMGQMTFDWQVDKEVRIEGAWLILKHEIVKILYDSGVNVEIARKTHNSHIGDDFLNVEIRHEDRGSPYVTGLIGQFLSKTIELERLRITDTDKIIAHLRHIRNNNIISESRASLVSRSDPVIRQKRRCWMLRQNGLDHLVRPDNFRLKELLQTPFLKV